MKYKSNAYLAITLTPDVKFLHHHHQSTTTKASSAPRTPSRVIENVKLSHTQAPSHGHVPLLATRHSQNILRVVRLKTLGGRLYTLSRPLLPSSSATSLYCGASEERLSLPKTPHPHARHSTVGQASGLSSFGYSGCHVFFTLYLSVRSSVYLSTCLSVWQDGG